MIQILKIKLIKIGWPAMACATIKISLILACEEFEESKFRRSISNPILFKELGPNMTLKTKEVGVLHARK